MEVRHSVTKWTLLPTTHHMFDQSLDLKIKLYRIWLNRPSIPKTPISIGQDQCHQFTRPTRWASARTIQLRTSLSKQKQKNLLPQSHVNKTKILILFLCTTWNLYQVWKHLDKPSADKHLQVPYHTCTATPHKIQPAFTFVGRSPYEIEHLRSKQCRRKMQIQSYSATPPTVKNHNFQEHLGL